MRIIIFEGREGVGKTALARALSEYTGWPVIHSNDSAGAHNDWGDESIVLDVLRAAGQRTVILDRSIISGWIYGRVLPQANIFAGLFVTVIHLLAPEATRRQRDPVCDSPEPERFDESVVHIAAVTGARLRTIDTSQSPEAVFAQVLKAVTVG